VSPQIGDEELMRRAGVAAREGKPLRWDVDRQIYVPIEPDHVERLMAAADTVRAAYEAERKALWSEIRDRFLIESRA
jgi:hypothetical protein